MSEVINAFHKDYVKTYMPEIMKDFRTHAANREERVEKKLKVKKTPLKTVTKSLAVKISKEQARLDLQKRKELMLNNRDFKYFSGAGMPKGVK
jgi:hemerythrin superfamily protein